MRRNAVFNPISSLGLECISTSCNLKPGAGEVAMTPRMSRDAIAAKVARDRARRAKGLSGGPGLKAEKRWSNAELVALLATGFVVMPIFYHVCFLLLGF